MTERDHNKWNPTEAERADLVARAELIVADGYTHARMFCSKRDVNVAYWITDAIHYFPDVLEFARKDASCVDWSWLKRDIEVYEHHRSTDFREIPKLMNAHDDGSGGFFRTVLRMMFRAKSNETVAVG